MVVWDTSGCVLGFVSLLIGVACWRFDGGRRIVPNFSSRLLATEKAPSVPVHRLLRPTESITIWEIDFKSELVKPWRAISKLFFKDRTSRAAANVHMAIKTDDQLHSIGTLFEPNVEEILNATKAFAVLDETDAVRRLRTEISPDLLHLSLDGDFSATFTEQTEHNSISLKFRKFALHAEGGGHYPQPKDIVHGTPEHQGTLLMAFNAKHIGGKLTISADGSQSEWSTARSSYTYPCFDWCAFHTNLTSNLEPVLSGAWAVLQFDIMVSPRAADAIIKEKVVEYGEPCTYEDHNGYYEENAFDHAYNALCERKGWSITATPTAVDSFLKKLQPYLQNQSIALPLFNSYQQAYLRPDFLKAADRTLFDALLASGRSLMLTPVVLSSKTFLNHGGPAYEAAPTDPFDEVYTQKADGEVTVQSATFASHPAIRFIWTNYFQHDKFFTQDCGGKTGNEFDVPEEYRYLSAAIVILSDSVVLQQEDKSQAIKPAKQE